MENAEGRLRYFGGFSWATDWNAEEKGNKFVASDLPGDWWGWQNAFAGLLAADSIDCQSDQVGQANLALHCHHEEVHAALGGRCREFSGKDKHRGGGCCQLKYKAVGGGYWWVQIEMGVAASAFESAGEWGQSAHICQSKVDLLGDRAIYSESSGHFCPGFAWEQKSVLADSDHEWL